MVVAISRHISQADTNMEEKKSMLEAEEDMEEVEKVNDNDAFSAIMLKSKDIFLAMKSSKSKARSPRSSPVGVRGKKKAKIVVDGEKPKRYKIETLTRHVMAHPEDMLEARDNSGIWCKACLLTLVPSYLKGNVTREKHKHNAKNKLAETERQAAIAQMLRQRFGSAVNAENVFRHDTVRTFMVACSPVHRLDTFRPYLEKWGQKSLTGRQHLMQDFVPIIASEEKELISVEIRGKKVSEIECTSALPLLLDMLMVANRSSGSTLRVLQESIQRG